MTATTTIQLLKPHPRQAEILEHPARFKVVACGRRFGKSTAAMIAEIETALRGGNVWHITPNYPQSTDYWELLKRTVARAAVKKVESVRRLDFSGGGAITVRSGHEPDSLRGSGLDLAVLDEAAFMPADVWRGAIRPALSDRKGRALLLSTPAGLNWFYSAFMDGQNPDLADWQAWKLPTSTNPLIDPAEIAAAKLTLPAREFAQEYMADFIEDSGAVFRNVRKVATGAMQAPIQGHVYQFGVDWGRSHDYTVISVIDTSVEPVRQVCMDRFTEIGWDLQRDRLISLYETYLPSLIYAEANSIGQPQIEALQRIGLPVKPFHMTSASKGPLIEGLSLLIEKDALVLLDSAILRGELLAYKLERTPSGAFRYSAPPGMHDDTVVATAISLYGISTGYRAPVVATVAWWV